ncbi:MAG: hypothetical protein H7X77_01145 [Anaerolineae bacterium]|nr:hypothetical protein [Anaerolineae bacterium]
MKHIFLLILLLLLAGCGSDSATPTTSGDPAQVVEQYLQAKITGDDAAIRPLLCAAKEADFEQEAASFDGVEAIIEGMTCQREDDSDIVRCEGQIIAVYNGENTPFVLGSYRVAQDDGVWKWCGEAG